MSLVFPYTQLNFIQTRQQYEFQEPSLRTKIFDINYKKQDLKHEIPYQKVAKGIKIIRFQGRLNNQCILITYLEGIFFSQEVFSQSNTLKIVYQTLKNDQYLTKNVILFSYENTQSLKEFLDLHKIGLKSSDFGFIRIALNINNQVRNKQKSKSNEMKAFLQIYGKQGVRSDVDHFQSIKQLLQRLHIQWSPCQEIHEIKYLKDIKKGVSYLNSYFPGLKSRISMFLDHILCQGYQSFLDKDMKGHQILMKNGFQSGSVTFLTNEITNQTEKIVENNEKIAKFSYSFIKEFSMQEDHLHSSSTLYYPISNHYYISLMGTVYGGLIFFIVGLVNVIGSMFQNSQSLSSSVSIFNLLQIFMFALEFKISGTISKSIMYLLVKSLLKIAIIVADFFKKKKNQFVALEYVLLTGISFLISLYFSIFNFSLFYISCLSSSLLLAKNKKIFLIVFILLIIWANYELDFDTIISQIRRYDFKGLQQFMTDQIRNIKNLVQTMSLQVKFAIFPMIYGFSTFLN